MENLLLWLPLGIVGIIVLGAILGSFFTVSTAQVAIITSWR